MTAADALPPLRLGGRTLLPIVQGGMGVGISAHRLAGTVARHNAVGTLASVDLRCHHPDLMARTTHIGTGANVKAKINAANLEALDREILAAKQIAAGRGLLAVNVMRAVAEYAHYVQQACASGIDAVVVGAGLPLDLPELTADFPQVALIPILSDARGIALILKKWERKGRLPECDRDRAPQARRRASGRRAARGSRRSALRFRARASRGAARCCAPSASKSRVPLIPAGGINTPQRVRQLLGSGCRRRAGRHGLRRHRGMRRASELQTRPGAKRARKTSSSSSALPGCRRARCARPGWIRYLKAMPKLQAMAAARGKPRARCSMVFDCLTQCGLRDGIAKLGQFCIDHQLAAALRGDCATGLFFRGDGRLPFGSQIRPVRDLIAYLLGEPVAHSPAPRSSLWPASLSMAVAGRPASRNWSVLPARCGRCRLAIDAGADTVYMGLRDATNARNFAGLNFDRGGHPRRHRLRARPRPQGADGAEHLRRRARLGAVAARRRYRRRPRHRRADPRRHRACWPTRRARTRSFAAPVGAGVGDQPRGDRVLPRALRHPRAVLPRVLTAVAGRAPDPQQRGRDRGVRLRQPVRDGRRPLPSVLLCDQRSRRTTSAPARRPRTCAGSNTPTAASTLA